MTANQINLPTENQPSAELDNYKFYITSNLMHNYDTGVVFECTNHRAIVYEPNGNYMFFAGGIDNDKNLQIYLFQENRGGNTPLERLCLTEDIAHSYLIKEIKVVQDTSNKPYLAILAESKSDGSSYLIYTSNFDKDIQQRWEPFLKLEQKVSQWGFGFTGANALIFTIIDEEQKVFFIDLHKNMQEIKLPTNFQSILEVTVVNIKELNDRGELFAYLLIKDTEKHNRLFVVGYQSGSKVSNFNHEIKIKYDNNTYAPSTLCKLHVSEGDSLLFVGANGLDNAKTFTGCKYFQITLKRRKDSVNPKYDDLISQCFTSSAEISKSIIVQNYEKNSLEGWFLSSYSGAPSNSSWLLHSLQKQKNDSEWSTPLPLMLIEDHYVVRNPHDNSIDIFVTEPRQDASKLVVQHLWIDKETSIWKKQPVQIADNTQTNQNTTNSTYIRVVDSNLTPLNGKTLQVSASQEVSVTINGKSYQLNPLVYVDIEPDAFGGLSIINNTTSIDTPIYLISLKEIKDAVRIKTTGTTKENLRNFDFQKAGVPEKQALEYKNFASEAIKAGDSIDNKTLDISVVPKDLTTSRKLQQHYSQQYSNVKNLPDDFFVAVSFYDEPKCYTNENEWNLYLSNNSLALKHQNLENWFSDIIKDISNAASEVVHDIGNVIQAVDNFLDKVEHFVIKKIGEELQLVINIAGEAINTIIHTVEQAWIAISTFVKKVIDTIEKIVEYLGYLLNWDDILLMHKFLTNTFLITANQYQIDIKNSQSNLNSFVDPVFNKAISYLESLEKERQPIDNPDTSSGSNVFSMLLNNPVVNFINDITGRGLSLYDGDGGQDNLPVFEFSGQISSDVEKIVNDIINTITGSISSISLSNIGDCFNTILDNIWDKILHVAKDLLETGRDLSKYLIKFIGELIDYILEVINTEIDIPLITWLYKNVITSGSKFTLSDLIFFVASVPTTMIVKLMGNFDPQSLINFNEKHGFEDFFGRNQLIPDSFFKDNTKIKFYDYPNKNADFKLINSMISTATLTFNLLGSLSVYFKKDKFPKLTLKLVIIIGIVEISYAIFLALTGPYYSIPLSLLNAVLAIMFIVLANQEDQQIAKIKFIILGLLVLGSSIAIVYLFNKEALVELKIITIVLAVSETIYTILLSSYPSLGGYIFVPAVIYAVCDLCYIYESNKVIEIQQQG